tara:strand:+ start:7245 stop:7823 length:579 start_codon:yes stop_codon:yes gene_type:complete
MSVNCISAFPSPILQFIIPEFADVRQQIVDNIYSVMETTESVSLSNDGGWQSPKQEPQPKLLFKSVDSIMTQFLNEELQYNIGNVWYNVNTEGSFNHKHTHPGCDLAAVFYVKVPEGDCGRIEIENPNYFNQVKLLDAMKPDIKESMIAFTSMWFNPVEGTGIIFPSHLMHRVSKNNTKEDRISISWNMHVN